MRTSCAPARQAARSPARTASVAPAPECCASRHRVDRHAERDAGLAHRRELALALATHQHPEIGGLVGDLARRLVDLPAQRGRAWRRRRSAPAGRRRSARASIARPSRRHCAAGGTFSMKVSGLAACSMLAPAADQQLRRAHARDQRQRGFELGREIGEIGELRMMRAAAVDDRARRRRTPPPERGGAREELLLRHARGVPVGRSHQQRRLHRVHGRGPDQPISASADSRWVNGSAPRAVNSTGSPHRR